MRFRHSFSKRLYEFSFAEFSEIWRVWSFQSNLHELCPPSRWEAHQLVLLRQGTVVPVWSGREVIFVHQNIILSGFSQNHFRFQKRDCFCATSLSRRPPNEVEHGRMFLTWRVRRPARDVRSLRPADAQPREPDDLLLWAWGRVWRL